MEMSTKGMGNSERISRHSFKLRRFSVLLLFCFLAIVIAIGAFSLNMFSPTKASGIDDLNVDQLNKTTLGNAKIVHNHNAVTPFHANNIQAHGLQPSVTPHDTGIVLPYNNVGTLLDKGTTNANFDGALNGYSQNALIQSGLYSGASWFGNSNYSQEIVFNGTTFDWPDVATGSLDNVVTNGQTISLTPPANASSLGFIGASTNGAQGGTATITYTDASKQTFSLKFDDWTLNGGSAKVSSFDKVATVMSYRDHKGGVAQNIKTYLFYTGVNLEAGKTVQSVTLPQNVLTHVFSVGFGLSTYFNPYNNTGISDNANASAANFDGGGTSYSMQEMSNYVLPGDSITYNGTQLYWPDVLAGSADNTTSSANVEYNFDPTYASGETKIGFIGSATNGPSCGMVSLTFTDSTTSSYKLCFSDWTLGGGKAYPSNGNMYFLGFPDRNAANGTKQNVKTYLFYNEIVIPSGRTIATVLLPPSTDHGQMHFFALGLGSGVYNTNVGSTVDNVSHTFGNFDGGHYSYSSTALQKAGVAPVQLPTSQQGIYNYLNRLTFNGVTFYWDQNFSTFPDNLIASGQQDLSLDNPTPNENGGTIPVNPVANATHLAFLGSATGGSSSGNITIKYSDGSTQVASLGFSDWCAKTPAFKNLVALSMSYRNSGTGSQTIANHLYYADVTLTGPAGTTPVSVTMPATSGGQMHIFSIGLK